jgi:hypothetical protein
VITPAVVTRPILLPCVSVNQRFPSGPETTVCAPPAVGGTNVIATPDVVTRVIPLLPAYQRFPSGPVVMLSDWPTPPAIGNEVIVPEVVLRLTLPFQSVNQTAPSGPDAIPAGNPDTGSGYSASICGGGGLPTRIIPILLVLNSVNQRLPSGPVAMT